MEIVEVSTGVQHQEPTSEDVYLALFVMILCVLALFAIHKRKTICGFQTRNELIYRYFVQYHCEDFEIEPYIEVL
ncbi:unnamed protein product [Caenorhabditis angaria]|uniref:Uncharacterized protein n=1 Tax=Caenorhabditis angaria TaxID=860376 RepID=A0A9P1I3S3_9PELO|nr:unnamed protein product [Caenorhabditis angaria]